jgi:hypothetical protein
LTFELILRISSPNPSYQYSDYQLFLYKTIVSHRKNGKSFNKISSWMNQQGHLTPKGKTFRGTHVFSILKKKQLREERLGCMHKPELRNFDIKFNELNTIDDS